MEDQAFYWTHSPLNTQAEMLIWSLVMVVLSSLKCEELGSYELCPVFPSLLTHSRTWSSNNDLTVLSARPWVMLCSGSYIYIMTRAGRIWFPWWKKERPDFARAHLIFIFNKGMTGRPLLYYCPALWYIVDNWFFFCLRIMWGQCPFLGFFFLFFF